MALNSIWCRLIGPLTHLFTITSLSIGRSWLVPVIFSSQWAEQQQKLRTSSRPRPTLSYPFPCQSLRELSWQKLIYFCSSQSQADIKITSFADPVLFTLFTLFGLPVHGPQQHCNPSATPTFSRSKTPYSFILNDHHVYFLL